MAIASRDDFIAARKQRTNITRTAAITSVAGQWTCVRHLAGDPGAGVLAVGNTANGIVPTDATAGAPLIQDFAGGASGHIGKVDFSANVPMWIMLFDRLFSAGAYAFNANVTLASQPSFSARVPLNAASQPDWTQCELWGEAVTAFTGNLSLNVGYRDESGADVTTGVTALGFAPIVGRMWQMPLASGDSGVQRLNSVTATVSSAGTFNVHIIRPLALFRVPAAWGGDVYGIDKVGLPQIFQASCLEIAVRPDSTSSGLPNVGFDILSK